jgi:hypothetical protein
MVVRLVAIIQEGFLGCGDGNERVQRLGFELVGFALKVVVSALAALVLYIELGGLLAAGTARARACVFACMR